MSKIYPKTKAIIDRLATFDPANPKKDKAAIEEAFKLHLEKANIPLRPFICFDSPNRAYEYFEIELNEYKELLQGLRYLHIYHKMEELYFQYKRRHITEIMQFEASIRESQAYLEWHKARLDCWDYCQDTLNVELIRRSQSLTYFSQSDFNYAVRAHSANCISDLLSALAYSNGYEANMNYITEGIAKIYDPMIKAFENGLFIYWITPNYVVYVLRPSMHIANGRLHNIKGPALYWPDQKYYFWHGIQMEEWHIETPERLLVDYINNERNQEMRRSLVEIYGIDRFLKDAGAVLVHKDECGALYNTLVGDEVWRIVQVENGTIEPDGTRRIYTLDVTCAEEELGWPITTARAAVAATYGLRPEEYSPQIRT